MHGGVCTWVHVSTVHSRKTCEPRVCRLCGNVNVIRDWQFIKAAWPIEVTLVEERSTETSPVFLKALLPIVTRLEGNEMLTTVAQS